MAEDVADASWHPTGFVVAKLHQCDAGALRLHVWPDDERVYGEPLWPVHDHAWSLRSLVLVGEVGSVCMRVQPDAVGAHRRYTVDYGAGRTSRLVRGRERFTAQPGPTHNVGAGGVYAVEEGEFHASSVRAGRLAATLVATRSSHPRQPFVLGPADGPPSVDVQRTAVECPRWRSLLAAVRAAC